jgi:uncharacterized membrane protein
MGILEIIRHLLFLLLAAGFANGAVGTLRRASPYAEIMRRVGVGRRLAVAISCAELIAAAGLVAGLVRPALGATAAAGIVALMAGAVLFHVRVHDLRGAVLPGGLGALASVAVALT